MLVLGFWIWIFMQLKPTETQNRFNLYLETSWIYFVKEYGRNNIGKKTTQKENINERIISISSLKYFLKCNPISNKHH